MPRERKFSELTSANREKRAIRNVVPCRVIIRSNSDHLTKSYDCTPQFCDIVFGGLVQCVWESFLSPDVLGESVPQQKDHLMVVFLRESRPSSSNYIDHRDFIPSFIISLVDAKSLPKAFEKRPRLLKPPRRRLRALKD